MGASGVGAGLGIVGNIMGGMEESSAASAKFQSDAARIRRNQARLRKYKEHLEVDQERSLRSFDEEGEAILGAQKSSFAKAGVDIGSGSALAVVAKSASDIKEERMAIKDRNRRELENIDTQIAEGDFDVRDLSRETAARKRAIGREMFFGSVSSGMRALPKGDG